MADCVKKVAMRITNHTSEQHRDPARTCVRALSRTRGMPRKLCGFAPQAGEGILRERESFAPIPTSGRIP